jgi:hypothetical protein
VAVRRFVNHTNIHAKNCTIWHATASLLFICVSSSSSSSSSFRVGGKPETLIRALSSGYRGHAEMVGIVMKLLPDSKTLILDRMKGMTPLIQGGELTVSSMYIALMSAYLSLCHVVL